MIVAIVLRFIYISSADCTSDVHVTNCHYALQYKINKKYLFQNKTQFIKAKNYRQADYKYANH